MKNTLKKMLLILLGAALLAGTLLACSSATESAGPLAITDDFGRAVTIKNTHPQRIISLAPSNTEILFALGLGDRIVGVTNYCDYPPEATTKPSVGAYNEPNIEEIIAREPDLVLATEEHVTEMAQIESRGITVVGLNPKTIDEVLASITLVGKITGTETEAASLVADMQKQINAIKDKTSALSEAQKPRVFYIIWHDPIWTGGGGSFADALIQIAGGVNIAHDIKGDAANGYVTISLEAMIAGNPQVVIAGVGMGTGEDLTLQYMKKEPRLASVEARQNNRVYGVNMDIVGRPGPRIVDALKEFFRLIHPEL